MFVPILFSPKVVSFCVCGHFLLRSLYIQFLSYFFIWSSITSRESFHWPQIIYCWWFLSASNFIPPHPYFRASGSEGSARSVSNLSSVGLVIFIDKSVNSTYVLFFLDGYIFHFPLVDLHSCNLQCVHTLPWGASILHSPLLLFPFISIIHNYFI